MKRFLFLIFAVASLTIPARAETVDVKYRGSVDLALFRCTLIERSSFIKRVCFDAADNYMIVSLNGAYYHYCGIDEPTVDAFTGADSMGRFFNASIKGHFDCRTGRVPAY
jgi:hypothetical protein